MINLIKEAKPNLVNFNSKGPSSMIKSRHGSDMGTIQNPTVTRAFLEYDSYNFEIKMGNSDGLIIGERNKYLEMIKPFIDPKKYMR